MKFRTFKYHVKQGIAGLLKNRIMAAASMVTVAACTFILIISLCIVVNLDYILEQVETTIGISVFIGDDVSDEKVDEIGKRIQSIEHVAGINYISEKDALELAKKEWGNEGLLDGLENDNPFPRSFDITLDGAKYQRDVLEALDELQRSVEEEIVAERASEKYESGDMESSTADISLDEFKAAELSAVGTNGYTYTGIENIRNAQTASDVLVTIDTAVRIIGIILIIIMCIISVGIIMNTIKLTVFVRKNEINIMKYVGATDWFIRWPFIVEGILIGIVGALVPCFFSWISYDEIINLIYENFIVIQKFAKFKTSMEMFFVITPIALIMGGFLGAFGSITSIRKHLNV